VYKLAAGQTREAITNLDAQGRIVQIPNRLARYKAIAEAYLEHPTESLVVSPDNQSRTELNHFIHQALQRTGAVDTREHRVTVLVPRSDMTGADRQWVARYAVGDVIRYSRGSDALGIKSGTYARVTAVDVKANTLSVRLDTAKGIVFNTTRYDPKRLSGVTVYREAERAFAVGDRVQFTAPDKDLRVANRELGVVRRVHRDGAIDIEMDKGQTMGGGPTVTVPSDPRRHLDLGYAVTAYSGQGQTAGYTLVHADTKDRIAVSLWHERTTYVAWSRPRIDLRVFTDNKERLPQVLSREVNQEPALTREQTQEQIRRLA
jgi:ATP-dependent exoDNAse (exonuclease V) alpha subunit